jgi:4-amino-4-deoxy-L-arabinose transferase-like glycosyltransferase
VPEVAAAPAFADPRRPWSWRWEAPLAVLLGLATLALRWSQRSRTPYTVDSVLFALATERYDVMALRPHPPGYPLFVALGKALLPAAGGDAHAALVLESALFSAVAVAALYALVRQWGSPRAALACALLFAVAPAFAFNGTVALSYTAEAAAGIVVALLAWRAATRPSPGRLAALGVAWALAVGVRQSLFLFLAPLVGLALLGLPLRRPRRADLRALALRAAVAGSASLAAALAWFLPMAAATGGVAEWRRATRLQSDHVVFADAVWRRGAAALQEHWDRLAFFLHWEAGLLAPMLAVLAIAGWLVRRRRRAPSEPGPWPEGAGLLLAAWLVPALLFYLLVFNGWERGPIGYVLTLLPGLYAAGVLLADHGLRRLAAAQPARLARGLSAFGLVLLLLPLPPLASEGADLIGREAHAHDRWAEAWQRLEEDYPAGSTAILAWQSWSHVQWAFPDHLAWTYFPSYKVPGQTDWALVFAMRHREHEGRFIDMYLEGPGRPEHPIPPEVRTIVLFDFQLAGENGQTRRIDPAIPVEEAHLSNGWRILLIRPEGRPTVESLFAPGALGR